MTDRLGPALVGMFVGGMLVAGLAVSVDEREPARGVGDAPPGAAAGDLVPGGEATSPAQIGSVEVGGEVDAPTGSRTGEDANSSVAATPRADVSSGRSAGDAPAVTSDDAAADGGPTAAGSGKVRIGFLILRVGSLAPAGVGVAGVDPEQQRAFINAYVQEHNERGGFHGRTIEPVFRDFEVLHTEDHRAACLNLTEDEKVFAVVGLSGGFSPNAVLCITDEHATPMLYPGDTLPTEYVQRSQGRLFSIFQHGNRVMFNFADQLHHQGRLKGAIVGILGDARSDPAERTMRDGLVAGLERVGTKTAHRTHLDAQPNTAASQIPLAVSQMRSKGVNLVLLATNTINGTNFVQTAESQGWRPRYAVTDWNSMYTDTTAQNMPASFDGAVAMTVTLTGDFRVNRPPPPSNARCKEIYERRTGRKLASYGSNEWGLTVNGCGLVDVIAAGLRNAGPGLTRTTLSAGIQQTRDIPVTQWRGGSFGRGKYDMSDFMRTNIWRRSCKCWLPLTEFVRTRY